MMENEVNVNNNFVEELVELIRSGLPDNELIEKLEDYHENDIAGAFEQLTKEERQRLYKILGAERVSEIFTYIEDVEEYIQELDIRNVAKIIGEMDSDDAVDILEEMDESTQEKVKNLLDEETSADINLIQSYDDDEIGSKITTNYICIHNNLTIKQAMQELVRQAGENDNISTIYVVDGDDKFYGAIELKDLIIARNYVELESLISTSYPFLYDHEKVTENIERIKDYAEDSLPVLNSKNEIIGIITAQDIIEVVDDEMGEDYAKLAGLIGEEDLKEKTIDSMKKRLPWLIGLLFLGILVSTVVGGFEKVVAVLPIVICFQSLILDMAGNVGTQSLAVTIRVLMDENLKTKDKIFLAFKEAKVGMVNGLFLGSVAFLLIGLYIKFARHLPVRDAFLISGCVGCALLVAMMISSLVGTLVPMFFHKIKIDPAVASGPLITTVNDLVAVVTYYGLAWVLLINVFGLG